jgi:hypothetical protein
MVAALQRAVYEEERKERQKMREHRKGLEAQGDGHISA